MKKCYKSILMMAAIIASLGFISCSDDDNEVTLSEQEKELQKINKAYVDNNVVAIYKILATESIKLQEAIDDLEEAPTTANMSKACTLWKSSRQYWEWSEAFLFGAASIYEIDPHIDTWPLDKTELNNLLNNNAMMANIKKTIANLNKGLVGYHGLEYIIFREGQERPVAGIPVKELKYAAAVAQDLALSCCRLEAAWAGMNNITAEKQEIIKDAEEEPKDNFGEQMELAGFAGSTWKTVGLASEQIIDGCSTIVDEVGSSKIGAPYKGEDINFIESPHAYNSIQDFYDNITGVQYALYGKMGATAPETLSIFTYIKNADSKLADNLQAALKNCLAKINAMPKPFVTNYKDAKVGEAIEACGELDKALKRSKDALKK